MKLKYVLPLAGILMPFCAYASGENMQVAGIRIEFLIFGLTLLGIAFFHKQSMIVALTGLLVLVIVKLAAQSDFSLLHHLTGSHDHEGEWKTLLNITGLLLGFGILARIFEESKVPEVLPGILPNDWKGGLMLLFLIMVLSSFLDNIAAAMIGGTIAMVVYKSRIHIGYLAAIIAASNAGGAGSVVGDTTTTIMWIDGVSPSNVFPAFLASIGAFLIFGIVGSIQQHRYQPIQKDADPYVKIDYRRLLVVGFILISAIVTNYLLDFPATGVWAAIILASLFIEIPWKEIKDSLPGTVFLTALVTAASLIPVEDLPSASWQTAYALGFVSSLFDNIPLTKLCLEQGNYDWGILAFAVGFGGSMLWFGSSAGVALTNKFPEGRSVFSYLKHGWHIPIAYTAGFFLMLYSLGWNPVKHKNPVEPVNKTEIIKH